MMRIISVAHEEQPSAFQRLAGLHWGLILIVCVVAGVGFTLLYSAAGGDFSPWATKQIVRFSVGFVILLVVALVPLHAWLRYAYGAYALAILLLVVVEFLGALGGGAERWIDLGFIRLQPSEVMKIALIMALARFFHMHEFQSVRRIRTLILPIIMIVLPVLLVLRQPDLGTAIILCAVGGVVFFLSGVRWWKFASVGVLIAAAVPFGWSFLHSYQKKRLLVFLDPESDPLGAGYHIAQSKIAMGSGGVWGKGYLQGTQIHLNFLPEMHTDFIFSVLAEEFGIVGGLFLLTCYCVIILYAITIGLRSRSQFGRLVAVGFGFTFFLYVFINLAMVMGLLPVVGVPLPLVSYGGTSMLTLLFGFGLAMSVHLNRGERLDRSEEEGRSGLFIGSR
jgi:rod shape determining protein RodA